MRFKKRSKLRSLTVMAVPNELLATDNGRTVASRNNKVELNDELPPGSSMVIQSPKSIFNRLLHLRRQNQDNGSNRRTHEIYALYDSERLYHQRLEEMVSVLQQLKSLGLSVKLLNIVEQCIRDVVIISANLLQSLEKIISKRSPSDDGRGLGDLFNDNFWNEYNRYHFLYCTTIKPYLHEVRKSQNSSLNEDFVTLEKSIGQRLETLFLLPEERIIAYHNHLHAILDCTPVHHWDYANLKRKHDCVEQSLTNNNNNRNNGNELKMRQITGRRKSTSNLPSAFSNNHNHEPTSSTDNVHHSGGGIMSRQRSLNKKPQSTENFVRVYIKEGRILLSSGSQTQERYLFLFSDLLLVAKEKGVNSYRLKDRVKLTEVWITCEKLDEISDCVKNAQNSFVIGWPTKNYVAEFCSIEERNSWYNLLQTQINTEKERECPKRTTMVVKYKSGKKLLSRKIAINNVQTSAEVLNMALNEFDPPLDDRRTLQLWAQCGGKESQQYALYGHECVFAILLSYVRDLLPPTDDPEVDYSLVEDLFATNAHFKCSFYLKHKRTPKKSKRHGAGHLVNQWKKRVMIRQESQDSFNLSASSSSPQPGGGKLFGQPLNVLTNEDNLPPKPILIIMENILKEGIFMEGIFRKPPNHKVFRELRDKLDAGIAVSLDGIPPSVGASLLKEFLRFLPDSVLVSSLFSSWISLCDENDTNVKLKKAQNIISQLPSANYELLRYLMCLLYHVKSKQSINQMNSYNLSICIGPSLINNATSMYSSSIAGGDNMNTKRVVEIVKFLIENTVELFGVETLRLLGDVPENPVCKHDSGEESDSLSNIRQQETSSLDSLVAGGSSPGSSRPQSALRYPTAPMNVSRDSGLSEVHVSSTDESGGGGEKQRTGGTTTTTKTPQRSYSQTEEVDNADCGGDGGFLIPADLVDSVESLNNDNSNKIKSSSAMIVNNKRTSLNDIWTKKNGGGGSKTESFDSLYESLESTCSCQSTPPSRQQHHHVRQISSASATLIRSESGDHLISIVEMNPAPNGIGVDRRHAFRQQKVSLAGGLSNNNNSTDDCNSSPVSPSSSGFDSPRSRHASPSPVSIMNRYSAVRKPARHRKGPAPLPPQVDVSENGTTIVSLTANDGDEDYYDDNTTSDNDECCDDIYEAQPIIIRCNSTDSADSATSSVEDDNNNNVHLSIDSRRISSVSNSHQTEIYSLKTPLTAIPFLKHSKSTVTTTPTDPPMRKLSLQSTNDIIQSLNEIKQQVNNTPVQLHQRVLLSALMGTENNNTNGGGSVNDSSTVTEASSEESTPHVSRESSRAQEYKRIADEMFKPASATPPQQQSIATTSPQKFQRSIGSHSQSPVAKTIDPETNVYRAKLVAVNVADATKSRPMSYYEAVAHYNDPVIAATPVTEEQKAARIGPATRKLFSQAAVNDDEEPPINRRVSVGPCTSEGAFAAAPLAPDHKLTIPISDGANQRRLRRKTLGSDEYAALNAIYSQNMGLDRCYSVKAVPTCVGRTVPADRNYSNTAASSPVRNHEISWSVKQFVDFFDNGGAQQQRSRATETSRLPWTRNAAVCDRLDLEVHSPARRTTSLYANRIHDHSSSPGRVSNNNTSPSRSTHTSLKLNSNNTQRTLVSGNGPLQHIVTVGGNSNRFSFDRNNDVTRPSTSANDNNASKKPGEESYV